MGTQYEVLIGAHGVPVRAIHSVIASAKKVPVSPIARDDLGDARTVYFNFGGYSAGLRAQNDWSQSQDAHLATFTHTATLYVSLRQDGNESLKLALVLLEILGSRFPSALIYNREFALAELGPTGEQIELSHAPFVSEVLRRRGIFEIALAVEENSFRIEGAPNA